MKRPYLITLLILIYCMINAADLIPTWVVSATDALGAAALLLWSSPVLVFWGLHFSSPGEIRERPVILGLALLSSFAGMLGSLHVLGHAGLALALGALLPRMAFHTVWLACAIAWMPAFDWLGGRFFPDYVSLVRIVLATLPSWFLIRSIQRPSRKKP